MKVYRIETKDNKYSRGGGYQDKYWTKPSKIGKFWALVSHVSSHLNLFIDRDHKEGADKYFLKNVPISYKEAEIVEYELVETRRFPVKNALQEMVDKKNNKVSTKEWEEWKKTK